MKLAAVWHVAYRSLIGAAKNLEVALTSETLLRYQIRRCHLSEHSNLYSEVLMGFVPFLPFGCVVMSLFLFIVFINETPVSN